MKYKIKILIGLLFVFTFLGLSCKEDNIQQSENGITIKSDSLITQLSVVSNNIIHVTKKRVGEVDRSEKPDFVTVLKPQNVDWKFEKRNEGCALETDSIKVLVYNDGRIVYTDKNNKLLLREINHNTFVKTDTTSLHKVSQSFDVKDEGLYGLGQFQSNRMNWKNVPVRLQQFNQEIAIPFLVSTNQYGLYWHNYGVTDFNFPKNEIEFTDVVNEKLNICQAKFTPQKTGNYNFFVISETPYTGKNKKKNKNRRLGPVEVTIDNDAVIHYNTMWYPDSFSGEKYLEAGKEYDIVFRDTHAETESRLLFNEPDFNQTVFSSHHGCAIDYYFIHGKNPSQILSHYNDLTGKAPMFKKSSYGFWQCREAYPTQEALLTSAKEYRKRKIPFDNIVQDWDYWPKGVKGPEWDKTRYPNPKKMTQELDSMHLNLMVSVWPTVTHEALCNRYDLENYKLGGSDFINFYDETTHEKYYRMLSDSMFHVGVQSIWLDGSEPIFHPNPEHQTGIGKFKEVENSYALHVTKAMYEGRRKEFPNERVFNLTRSAFAGQQRYGNTVWSGDVDGNWEQFEEQIAAGINFTMTGFPYWTTDIGGFFRGNMGADKKWKDQYTNPDFIELLTRWFQYGAFSPIFRIHGYRTHTEIWNYNQEFEDIARKFIDVRYQLMPYIYSQAWEITQNGKQLMTPLVYHYPNDKNVWAVKDQFFFGESMMVCPVLGYQTREREVYLPEGDWYDYWTGEKLQGAKTIKAPAPLNALPVYVKAGSILPIGPKVQYATEPTDKPLLLKVYPGKDANFKLYYDDNESYAYENGTYSEIKVSYSETTKSLKVETGHNAFLDLKNQPKAFRIELVGTKQSKDIKFNGETLEVKLN